MWDVVVVGAGPAGASAALAALRVRPEARVLLLDRDGFPRDKVCGDGVAPHALDVLEGLGVPDLVADWAPVSTLELGSGTRGATRRMARPARVVPRRVLDARLVEAATAAGAELRRHRVRRVTLHPDRVVLDDHLSARVAVAADGAHSVLRRSLRLRPARRALAVRGYAPTRPEWRGRQVIRFGSTRQPSYAWAFDRGDGWANVGYGELLRPGRTPPTRTLMQDQLNALLPQATQGARDWRAHHLPLSAARWAQPDGRVLLAGDAAALVNPLTGEGIYYAVATGARAGSAAVGVAADGDPGRTHRRAVRRLLAPHLVTTAAMSRVAHAPGVLHAALRSAAADQGAFDDLVEIGLGRGLLSPRLTAALLRHAGPVRWA